MTEKERILQKGIIPESFFQEETRCEFHVTEERKKIWAVLLDMLFEVDRVCKKHNLKYFLFYGSLLGAVRHKGFIPWDDDLDVVMPREDYEIFCKLSCEFESPYFLQTPYTDSGYFYSFTKIRNSNTSAVNQAFRYEHFNQGIFLDVFPLDGWNLVGGEERYLYVRTLTKELSIYMRRNNPLLTEDDRRKVSSYCGRNPFEIYEEIQSIAKYGNLAVSENCMTAVITMGAYHSKTHFKEDFKNQVYIEFEGFKFPVPSGYERVLMIEYGDFMQFPSIERRGEQRSEVVFDTDRPYTDYVL